MMMMNVTVTTTTTNVLISYHHHMLHPTLKHKCTRTCYTWKTWRTETST